MYDPEIPFAPVTTAVKPFGAFDKSGKPCQMPFDRIVCLFEVAIANTEK